MSFLVKHNWRRLNRKVWKSLQRKVAAPPDLYIELLRFARRKLDIQVDGAADEALGDPDLAREEFFKLPEPQDESKCLELLGGYHGILQEFRTEISEHYRQRIREFVAEHNLRYVVSDDCRFQLSVQGLLASNYEKLRKQVSASHDIEEGFKQLEDSVSKLKDIEGEERNCIGIATNVIEGIACSRTTNNQNTLGAAIEGCNVFPHKALMRCVKDFYKFASDYPNIRHAGSPGSRLRDLKKDDALLAVTLAVAFGSYILDNNSGDAILAGDL